MDAVHNVMKNDKDEETYADVVVRKLSLRRSGFFRACRLRKSLMQTEGGTS